MYFMNIRNTKIIGLGLTLFSLVAYGQIKEETLVIQRAKHPTLKKVQKKKTSVPKVKNYPPEEKSAEKIEYTITNIPLLSDFKTSLIQGEDLSPNQAGEHFDNYVRFGIGNYGKILGDAGFTAKLGENTDLNAAVHINSTSGLKKIYPWKSTATDLELKAGVNHYLESGKLNANVGFDLDAFHYYGIYAFNDAYRPHNSLAQRLNTASLQAVYDHYNNHILNDIRIKASHLSDAYKAHETEAALKTNLAKHGINTHMNDIRLNVDAGLGVQFLGNSFQEIQKLENNYFQAEAEPKITFYKGKTSVSIGSNFTMLNARTTRNGERELTSKTYWFPKAEVKIAADDAVQLILGVKGGLMHNAFGHITSENPFMLSHQYTQPTEEKYHLYFGLTGDIQQKVSYHLSFGTAKTNAILHFGANPLFNTAITNDRNGFDHANTFQAKYANGNINQFALGLTYVPLQNLTLNTDLNIFDYKLDNNEKILNRPNFTASFGANYFALDKKLLLGAKAYLVGTRETNFYTLTDDTISYTATEDFRKLPAYFDLNLSAEYLFHKNFSAFLMGDNLLNKNYEIFQGYKVLGAQITGGVKFRF